MKQTRTPRLPVLKEADIQRAVSDLLAADGWRVFRMELTVQLEYGRVVGERGMPDCLYIRYMSGVDACMCGCSAHCVCAQVLWVEFKTPTTKPTECQRAWHMAEVDRGALVLIVDGIDAFRKWYSDSGLARNVR